MIIITYKIKISVIIALLIYIVSQLIFNAAFVSNEIIKSIYSCITKLIPSLFPMMVTSSFAISSGIVDKIIKVPKKILSYILGVDSCFTSVILSSFLSGYLIGPIHIERMSKSTKFTKNEYTKCVLLSTNAGIGYVLIYVGITIWNSLSFGFFLYFTQIASSLLISRAFIKTKKENRVSKANRSVPLITAFSTSVKNATKNVVYACGFTVFFSVLISILVSKTTPIFKSAISSIFEISSGITFSCEITNTVVSAFFTGFGVGFGGICILIQTLSICSSNMIDKKIFFVCKFLQGMICGLFSSAFAYYFEVVPVRDVYLSEVNTSYLSMFFTSIFIFVCIIAIKEKVLNFFNKTY